MRSWKFSEEKVIKYIVPEAEVMPKKSYNTN